MMRQPQQMQTQFRQPPVTTSVLVLIAILFVGWLAPVLLPELRTLVADKLVLDATTAPSLELWAVGTYALFPYDFFSVAISGFLLYLFGGELEGRWGATKWWVTVLLSVLVAGILAMLVMWPLGLAGLEMRPIRGATAITGAFVGAYCWYVWTQRMFIFSLEVTGKNLLMFFLAFDAIIALLTLNPAHLVVDLAGIGVGLLMAQGRIPTGNLIKQLQYWRIKRRLRVISRTPESDVREGRRREDGTWIN
ncbi:MAG: rhomboid family intramembrane serine protease [Myxococcota bacterium]